MGQAKKPQDIDSRILSGCTGFVIVSLGTYVSTVWPFMVWMDAFQLSQVLFTLAIGCAPAAILGIFATRRWGVPGGAGFVGGALASGLFFYMRLDAAQMLALGRQTPPLDYPTTLKALLPLAWILLTIFLAIAFAPKENR